MTTAPPRIGIDARMQHQAGGGVQQFVLGLASGLASLGDGPEEYLFLTYADDAWLVPHVGGRCRVLRFEEPLGSRARRRLKRSVPGLGRAWAAISPALPSWGVSVPEADPAVEAADLDLVHFSFPNAFRTSLPSIYQPWDLQHLHLPELFSARTRSIRAAWYPAFCAQARAVVTQSEWGKRDLVETLGVAAEKIFVIPPAAPTDAYERPTAGDLDAVRSALGLPDAFLLYPAQTWRHKNHLGLLEAVALLRSERSLDVPVVCTGHRNSFFPTIRRRAVALGVDDLVRFVGFVQPLELRALYELARGLVFPTLFEGWGFPVTEAFACGVPVACSAVSCLPEVVGDAALLFDPHRPDEIAAAMERLWLDDDLRRDLVGRGRRSVAALSWERVATEFRALYRSVVAQAPA